MGGSGGGEGGGDGGELHTLGTSQPTVTDLAVRGLPLAAELRATLIPMTLVPGGHRTSALLAVTPEAAK